MDRVGVKRGLGLIWDLYNHAGAGADAQAPSGELWLFWRVDPFKTPDGYHLGQFILIADVSIAEQPFTHQEIQS